MNRHSTFLVLNSSQVSSVATVRGGQGAGEPPPFAMHSNIRPRLRVKDCPGPPQRSSTTSPFPPSISSLLQHTTVSLACMKTRAVTTRIGTPLNAPAVLSSARCTTNCKGLPLTALGTGRLTRRGLMRTTCLTRTQTGRQQAKQVAGRQGGRQVVDTSLAELNCLLCPRLAAALRTALVPTSLSTALSSSLILKGKLHTLCYWAAPCLPTKLLPTASSVLLCLCREQCVAVPSQGKVGEAIPKVPTLLKTSLGSDLTLYVTETGEPVRVTGRDLGTTSE